MGIPETITELLEPVVATLDVELLDVEWNGNSLRIVVDRQRQDGDDVDKSNGVTTSELQAVNRLISPILDQHDPIPGRYTLEVSSPGVERKLAKPEHFVRAVGEEVIVKMIPDSSPRRVRGVLSAFDESSEMLTISAVEVDGVDQSDPEDVEIELMHVQKARTSFNWGPGPKPGKSASKSKKNSGSASPPSHTQLKKEAQ